MHGRRRAAQPSLYALQEAWAGTGDAMSESSDRLATTGNGMNPVMASLSQDERNGFVSRFPLPVPPRNLDRRRHRLRCRRLPIQVVRNPQTHRTLGHRDPFARVEPCSHGSLRNIQRVTRQLHPKPTDGWANPAEFPNQDVGPVPVPFHGTNLLGGDQTRNLDTAPEARVTTPRNATSRPSRRMADGTRPASAENTRIRAMG